MQAIWRGAINFGLITIPVRVFSATEEKSVRFHMLHKDDNGRIRFNRTCEECGQTRLGRDDFARGYEYEKGASVVFTDEEIRNIAEQVDTSHTVEVVNFVPAAQIDPVLYMRSYYLAPDEIGTKAYSLLRKALADTDRVAIAKVAIRDKERLATLRVRDKVLVLETMYWPDEIREPAFPELDKDGDVREQELEMATSLIENMTEDFDPDAYHDTYRELLLKAVEQKIEGREIVAPAASDEGAPEVVDIMDALRKSIEQTKGRKKASGE